MSGERFPKQVFDRVIPGRKRQGRPMRGCRQGVEEMLRRQLPSLGEWAHVAVGCRRTSECAMFMCMHVLYDYNI